MQGDHEFETNPAYVARLCQNEVGGDREREKEEEGEEEEEEQEGSE
jgi:hypothetical protein